MKDQKNVIDCYNKTAKNYAGKFLHELDLKHLDKILLKAFAEEHKHGGPVIDLGCGPGQTTLFLANQGIKQISGIDLSEQMIAAARSIHPQLKFETGDMLKLAYPDNSFSGAIAFYSIVHFDDEQLRQAFTEAHRVLKPGGSFLFSYHIGNHLVHLDQFLEQTVDIDFRFFDPNLVKELFTESGFVVVDLLEREPYPEEYQTKRAYSWVKKTAV